MKFLIFILSFIIFHPIVMANGFHDFLDSRKQFREAIKNEKVKLQFLFKINEMEDNIYEAVKRDDLPAVKKFIASGVDLNKTDEHGLAPFHYVKTSEMQRLLIDNNADVNILTTGRSTQGYTPLHFLHFIENENERIEMAKQYFANNANPNTQNTLGHTPFHLIFAGGSMNKLDLVYLFFDNKANPFIQDKYGNTPYGVSSLNSMSLLHSGFELQLLFFERTLNTTEDTIYDAVKRDDIPAVKKFIASGGGVKLNKTDKSGRAPLHYVKSSEMQQLLIDNKADVNILTVGPESRGSTSQNLVGLSPLHFATMVDDPKERLIRIEQLFANNADPNLQNARERTPFHFIMEHRPDDLDSIRLFIAHKADPRVSDMQGKTPKKLVSWRGNKLTKQLFKKAFSSEETNTNKSETKKTSTNKTDCKDIF